MLSVLEIIKKTTDFFASKGIDTPRLDAELLIGHSLGLKRMQLYLQFERFLTEAELEKIRPLVRRRASREPLQHILGDVEWHGLKLKVDRRALIPRPETELLVEIALATAQPEKSPQHILDLGTGTGALALAFAKAYPTAQVTAVDASEDALALARENASALALADRVSFLKSDWFSALNGSGAMFDLIVSNPPYLTASEVAEAEPEVRQFEPHSALVAPNAGCADLLKIISQAPAFLNAGGVLAMETGIAQHEALRAACASAGLISFESHKDLTGRDRFVVARKG